MATWPLMHILILPPPLVKEPHVTGITLNPGRVARMLSQSAMPRKYLPVQFVEAGDTAWAFVILSAAVSHEDAENQELWPKDWIIMTK